MEGIVSETKTQFNDGKTKKLCGQTSLEENV